MLSKWNLRFVLLVTLLWTATPTKAELTTDGRLQRLPSIQPYLEMEQLESVNVVESKSPDSFCETTCATGDPQVEVGMTRPRVYKATIEDEHSSANDSLYFDQASITEDSQVAPVEWKAMPQDDDPTEFTGRWNHGLWFTTKDGSFKANIGGRIEQDWTWYIADPDLQAATGPVEDGVFFRRARIHGAGTIYDVIDFYAEFEAAPVDNIQFQDMWGQIRGIPYVGHLRVGHVKVPFGLENYTSAKYLTFMERSAVHDAFQQEYDPGMMLWNYNDRKDITWALALLRLDRDESGRAFGNGQYSASARLTSLLIDLQDERILFHVGGGYRYDNRGFFDPVSGTHGVQYRARAELRNTSRLVNTGFIEAAGASYANLEAAIVLGPFSAQAEYVSATVQGALDPISSAALGNMHFDGYYVFVSYFLTGESRPYDHKTGRFGRVSPRQNFQPKQDCGLQGAWELGARYSNVDLDDDGITGGKLETATAGLTWYINPNAKVMMNYIYALRNPTASLLDQNAHLFGLRLHLAF